MVGHHGCVITGCGSTRVKNPNLSFFRFPVRHPERLKQWLENVGREDLNSMPLRQLTSRRICSLHFTADQFANSSNNRLTKYAVPTIFG